MASLLSRLRWHMFAWPQFGLCDLLLFTVASAVGVAALVNDWAHGLLVGVSGAIVVGLLIQAYDLAWAFHGQKELTPDERHGWQFAVFWRIAVFVIYVLQLGLDFLAPRTEFDQIYPGALQVYLYGLLALTGLLSGTHQTTRPLVTGRWRWILRGATWCVALWVASQILKSGGTILILVHRAVMGSVWAQPGLRREEWSTTALKVAGDRFYAVAQAAALTALIALLLIAVLARQWRRPLWRWPLMAAVLAAVMCTTLLTVWLSTTGLTAASPFFVEVPQLCSWQCNSRVVVMVLIVTTTTAFRFVSPWESPMHVSVNWQRHGGAYLHLWRTISLLLAVAAIGYIPTLRDLPLWSAILDEQRWYQNPLLWWKQFDVVTLLVTQPESLMLFALVIVAIRGTFVRRQPVEASKQAGT